MTKSLLKKFAQYAIAGLLCFHARGSASDLFIGVKPPFLWQLDQRISYFRNEEDLERINEQITLKYWDGDQLGKWGFLHVPYQFVRKDETQHGFGDMSFGIGPRGKFSELHWFLYGGLKLPTGEAREGLGSDSFDFKLGLFSTYLTENKKFEVDFSLEYLIGGEKRAGGNQPDELLSGFLIGAKITEKIRFGTGITATVKDYDAYLLNSRAVLRYTFSPSLHTELVGDFGLESKDLSKGMGIGLFLRYNF